MDDLPGWSEYVSHSSPTQGPHEVLRKLERAANGTAKGQTAQDYAKYMIAPTTLPKSQPDCMVGMACQSAQHQLSRPGDQGRCEGSLRLHRDASVRNARREHDVSGMEPMFMNLVPAVRKMLAATDPERANVPIWLTEIGYEREEG